MDTRNGKLFKRYKKCHPIYKNNMVRVRNKISALVEKVARSTHKKKITTRITGLPGRRIFTSSIKSTYMANTHSFRLREWWTESRHKGRGAP